MRRWRRRLLRVGLAVTAGVVAGVSELDLEWSEARVAGEKRLAEQVARLDAADPGWRLADLRAEQRRTAPPDERNSAVQAVRVWRAVPDAVRPDLAARARTWASPPAADPNDWRAELKAFADTVAAARRLDGLAPGGLDPEVPADNPLDTRIPHVDAALALGYLLDLDARVAAADGDADRAFADLSAALSLAAGLDGDWSYLVWKVRLLCGFRAAALAEHLLGRLTAAPPAELERRLRAEGDADRAALAVRGERAILDLLFQRVDDGRVRPRAVFGFPRDDIEAWLEPLGDWRFRGDLPADRAKLLEVLTGWETAFRRPLWERGAAFAAVELPPVAAPHLLTLAVLPSFDKLLAAELRTKARLRSAAVGLGCERFRRQHGRWPASLADMNEPIPSDPFDGQPLRFRGTADGVLVYSVGPDHGDAIGFRLWDVNVRRLAR